MPVFLNRICFTISKRSSRFLQGFFRVSCRVSFRVSFRVSLGFFRVSFRVSFMASLGLIYDFCRVHLGFHSGFQLRCHLFFFQSVV